MPTLVDTTIRLLGQEPLAGRVPTAVQLEVAEVLDGAGFAVQVKTPKPPGEPPAG